MKDTLAVVGLRSRASQHGPRRRLLAPIVGLAFLCALLLWLEWKRRQGVDAVQAVESVAQVAYKKGAEGVRIRGANFTSPGLMERAGDAVARLSSAGSAASFPSEAREKAF